MTTKGRLGILVGGGPAPGINGVIAAATIEGINNGFEVIGFRDGFKYLAQGDTHQCKPLTIRDVSGIHLRGGSILGTSRTNPTKSEASMQNVFKAFEKLGVTTLVTIGGDDTAFSASRVAKQSKGKIKVAHVPKTIDNDLPLPGSTPTFGFETARHYGVQIVRNLMKTPAPPRAGISSFAWAALRDISRWASARRRRRRSSSSRRNSTSGR